MENFIAVSKTVLKGKMKVCKSEKMTCTLIIIIVNGLDRQKSVWILRKEYKMIHLQSCKKAVSKRRNKKPRYFLMSGLIFLEFTVDRLIDKVI